MNLRSHTWLSLLTAAANEAYRWGLLDPAAENCDPLHERTTQLLTTLIQGQIPTRVWLTDWKFDELKIVAAGWPSDAVDDHIHVVGAEKDAGDAVARGYLIRGKKLRLDNPLRPDLFVRRHRLEAFKNLQRPDSERDLLGLYPFYLNYPTLKG